MARGSGPAAIQAGITSQTDDCILWPGATTFGYGSITINGKTQRAHEVVLRSVIPKPSSSHVTMHVCDVRNCINIRHLRWGTQQENVDDMMAKGRGHRGRRAGLRLSDADVRDIRSGRLTRKGYQSKYGLSKTMVQSVITGKQYAHVT